MDILGPANARNAVTQRPDDDRSFGANDTWWKDCSSPTANDGTKWRSAPLNSLVAQLRSLIRGNGNTALSAPVVIEDNSDTMLLTGVQQLIQRGQTVFAQTDSGSADALVATLSPAPVEYKAGQRFTLKKINAPNATTSPTINVNGLGPRTIVDRRGQVLAPGDLPGSAFLDLEVDSATVRFLGIVSADLGVIGTLRNVQKFSTSARVSMSGTSGNGYIVAPWSPGTYVKQSATSLLFVLATFPTFTGGPTGSAQGTLNVGGTPLIFIPSNNNSSLSFGQGSLIQTLSGIGAGALPLSLAFQRNDATPWTGSFCFNNTDSGSYPLVTTATIIMAELGV